MSDNIVQLVPNTGVAPTPMSDEEALDFTQRHRKDLVDVLTANGAPTDGEVANVLLKTLDGMDRQALTKMKIKSDERTNDNSDKLAASVIAGVFAQLKGKNPYEKEVIEGQLLERAAPAVDLSKLPAIELVPGETDIGTSDLTYESFTASQGKKRPQNPEEDLQEA
ncbi:MAG TPA: hypothetical protein VN081_02450 [Dongiaceae bacterium]|nr:hypothetical protein [Dongiaceae bacterium]